MSRWYLDTSAAVKLLVEEAESAALADALTDSSATAAPDLVACLLLETELRRIASREPELNHQAVTHLLQGVSLYELPIALFTEAGLLPGRHLRSLDALHLAAAIRLGVDAVVTYDARMATAAHDLGLSVAAPS